MLIKVTLGFVVMKVKSFVSSIFKIGRRKNGKFKGI